MDFALSETQQLLADSIADFLDREMSQERRSVAAIGEQLDRPLWSGMAVQGWLALGVGDESGLFEQALLAERVGTTAAPIPYVATAAALAALEGVEAGADLVAQALTGDRIVLFVDVRDRWTVDGDGAGAVLSGVAARVPHGAAADVLVVLAGPAEAPVLCALDLAGTGVRLTPRESMAYDASASAEVSRAPVLFAAPLSEAAAARLVLRRDLCAAAEGLGAAQRSFEMAVDYAMNRVQFGRPIGAFQAVQHLCADMALALDGTRFALRAATVAFDDGDDESDDVITMRSALLFAHRTFMKVTAGSHEVFGGVGFFVEHELHYYTRRVASDLGWMGSPDHHLAELASALLM